MKLFAQLYSALDETTQTNVKLDALVEYLKVSAPEDSIWAISFLIGRKPRQIVPTRRLKEWSAELAAIPSWLFEASYEVVGDLAETITLLLPQNPPTSNLPLHVWVQEHLLPLSQKDAASQREEMMSAWQQMDKIQRLVWNKLITGGFRIGVSKKLVTRALARFSGIDATVIAHRLMGNWTPTFSYYQLLFSRDTRDADSSRPYPFYLAYPLDEEVDKLGNVAEWQAEWKWDGIRAQLIKRENQVYLWSRGEELITEKFPEIGAAGNGLPNGSAIDGEILPWKDDRPLGFSELQCRIARKSVGRKILETIPVILIAYDLLEMDHGDVRQKPLSWRVEALARLLADLPEPQIRLSPIIKAQSWAELAEAKAEARRLGVEGLMLKKSASAYGVGRHRGDWWKWKIDPLTVDAVLIYAQGGHGRRSGLYTDYTFAVWHHDKLVPFAKAYSGLSDAEIRQVDRFIRTHTLERFGPVRSVKPELVFEIAFEDIRKSPRHKSGIAVRFPRISRWRTDKKIEDADSLETIMAQCHESIKSPIQRGEQSE
jgi:DNA ligase-1